MRLLTTAWLCIFASFYITNTVYAQQNAAENSSVEANVTNVSAVDTTDKDFDPALRTVNAEEDSIQVNLPAKSEVRKSESEIPVFTDLPKKKAEAKSPYFRMLLSLGIIGIVCIGGIFFSKWWRKNHRTQADNNRIKVLNQHFLGPKKSLAIVRVAGESILIGVTDNNISHIRTLSLIDEEDLDAESVSKNSFDLTLKEKSFRTGDDDEFSFGDIKDRVTRSERGQI